MPPTVEDRLRDIVEPIAEIEDLMRGVELTSSNPTGGRGW